MVFYKLLSRFDFKALAKRFSWAYTKNRTSAAMSELNKHIETIKGPLLTAGVVSMLGAITFKADQYLGTKKALETSGADLDFYTTEKPGADKMLVLLGGLCMSGTHVAERYANELADDVDLISPMYGSNGFNHTELFDKLYEQLDAAQPKEIMVAGLSMGGLLACDWLNYGAKNNRKDITDKVSSLVVRGVPASNRAIRPGPRMLLNTASRLGYSYALEQGRPLLKRWNCVSIMEATPATIVQQCRYLTSRHAEPLEIVPAQVTFVRGGRADPVVDEAIAISAMEQRLGRPIEQAIDTDYQQAAHIPTDRQSVRFMLNQLGIAKHETQTQQANMLLHAAA